MYCGMWRLNERHGYGLYWDEEKKFHYKGHFSDGNLNGPAMVMMTNVQFNGNFENGKVNKLIDLKEHNFLSKAVYSYNFSYLTRIVKDDFITDRFIFIRLNSLLLFIKANEESFEIFLSLK